MQFDGTTRVDEIRPGAPAMEIPVDVIEYQYEMAVERLRLLREKRDQAEQEFETQQNFVLELFAVKKKSMKIGRFQIVRRSSERILVDESKLRKAIGAPAFNKLTERKLVRAKLNDAVAAGVVDPVILASCTEIKETKSWVSIKEVGNDEPDSD